MLRETDDKVAKCFTSLCRNCNRCLLATLRWNKSPINCVQLFWEIKLSRREKKNILWVFEVEKLMNLKQFTFKWDSMLEGILQENIFCSDCNQNWVLVKSRIYHFLLSLGDGAAACLLKSFPPIDALFMLFMNFSRSYKSLTLKSLRNCPLSHKSKFNFFAF